MRVCLRIAWRKIVDGSREDSTSVLKGTILVRKVFADDG
jgi:hypothetical protein